MGKCADGSVSYDRLPGEKLAGMLLHLTPRLLVAGNHLTETCRLSGTPRVKRERLRLVGGLGWVPWLQ